MTAVQQDAEVLAVAPVGEYVSLTLVAPGIAAEALPGQFLAVSVGGPQSAMVLRRSFPLHAMTPAGDYAGTVQFVIDPAEAGRQWLARRRPGDLLRVAGPFGTPFPLPPEPGPVVLVGEDHATAALIPLARALIEQGCTVEIVVGARTARRLFGELLARRTAGEVTVATEDGSAGERGRTTDLLPLVVSRSRAQAVYAAGPAPMLQAVAQVAAAHSVPAIALIDAPMPCGIGVCQACVLPMRGPGGAHMERSCVEGPVFAADRVDWARLPAEAVDAPYGRAR